MKKWVSWWILSAIWVIGAVINFFDNRSILGCVVSAALFFLLGIAQLFCDRHGEKGKKVLTGIYIASVVFAGVFLLAVILFVTLK